MKKRSAPRDSFIEKAKTATQESRVLDFKGQFEDTHECWCGLVKDIIALANTGGGILVFGLNSDGTPSGSDCSALMKCDVTVITAKVFKWTNFEFAELETISVARAAGEYPALVVGEADMPIPFTKRGEWETAEKKKKTEFVEGTVYFRHGASSAPATRGDFARWIERYATRERQRLMKGVKKMMAAPAGHVVAAVTTAPMQVATGSAGLIAKLSNDPDAMKIMPHRAADFYPHRRLELQAKVNKAIKGAKISSHDITSINRVYDVFAKHPEFATKPHDKSSPLYSDQYPDWIVEHTNADPKFLSDARKKYSEWQKAKGISYAPKKRKGPNRS